MDRIGECRCVKDSRIIGIPELGPGVLQCCLDRSRKVGPECAVGIILALPIGTFCRRWLRSMCLHSRPTFGPARTFTFRAVSEKRSRDPEWKDRWRFDWSRENPAFKISQWLENKPFRDISLRDRLFEDLARPVSRNDRSNIAWSPS